MPPIAPLTQITPVTPVTPVTPGPGDRGIEIRARPARSLTAGVGYSLSSSDSALPPEVTSTLPSVVSTWWW